VHGCGFDDGALVFKPGSECGGGALCFSDAEVEAGNQKSEVPAQLVLLGFRHEAEESVFPGLSERLLVEGGSFECVGCAVGYAGVTIPQALDELEKLFGLGEDECADFASAAGVEAIATGDEHRSD
jgi:hypothetical protein